MSTFLIVGAGLTGATIAERLAHAGHEVIVFDRRNHVAGNCFDAVHPGTDVLAHRYGPHIFHTNSGRIWAYVNQFSKFRLYNHRVLGHISGLNPFPIPVNANSIRTLFGSEDCKKYARALLESFQVSSSFTLKDLKAFDHEDIKEFRTRLFDMVYRGYSSKMWGSHFESIDESVYERIPIRISSNDDRHFQDQYQGIPVDGYTVMVQRMLDHPNISIETGINVNPMHPENPIKTVWTGGIDDYFGFCFGRLPYRSMEFRSLVSRAPDKIQQCAQYNFNDPEVPITRTVEHRWITGQDSLWTVRTSEWPCEYEPGKNEPLYPIPTQSARSLYEKYLEKSKECPNVRFAGRLGRYQYFNMDQAVASALALVESDKSFFS